MSENKTEITTEPNGRHLGLFVGGLILLGIAATVLLFGGKLFGEEMPVLGQIPAANTSIEQIPSNGLAPQVGETAVDFTLVDLDDNTISLSQFRGQPVIINFWATWCAPCRLEMPDLQQASLDYADDNLVVLAVNQDEPAHAVRSFFYDQLGLTFTPLLDEGARVSDSYATNSLPTTYFVNASGTITAIHRGILAREQIDGYLAETIQ